MQTVALFGELQVVLGGFRLTDMSDERKRDGKTERDGQAETERVRERLRERERWKNRYP